MKYSIFLVTILFLSSAFSAEPLSVKELQDRFELRTDVYTMDSEGKRVLFGPEYSGITRMSSETGKLSGGSSNSFNENKIYFNYTWEILKDGSSKLVIEEYQNGGSKFTGLIEKKEIFPQNFETVLWKPKRKNPSNIVVRFHPVLREVSKTVSLDGIPMSASNASITDSEGFLWGDELNFNGKYSGFKTHRGSLVMSYTPFKGSTEMGSAEGKQIILKPSKNFTIKIVSATDVLPNGLTAKVYATYDPNQKSKSVHSVHGWDSQSESRILEGFRN